MQQTCEDIQQRQDNKVSYNQKVNILWLFILYSMQGIVSGFFYFVLPLVLTEQGADYSDIGLYYFSFLPYSLKVITSPIIDSKFSKAIGRRKTYILPCQYLVGIVFIFISPIIQQQIESKSYLFLSSISFLCIFLVAQQEIASDALGLCLLQERNRKYAPTCCGLGQMAGALFSCIFIILFNFSIQTFLATAAIILITITTLMIFYLNDDEQKDENNKPIKYNTSITAAYKLYANFWENKNIRILLAFLLLHRIFISAVPASFPLRIMQQGVTKEYIYFIDLIQVPIYIILPIATQESVVSNREMTFQRDFYLVRMVVSGFGFLVVTMFLAFEVINGKILVAAFIILDRCCLIIASQGLLLFFNRISDKVIGGMYITLLNNTTSLGNTLSYSITLLLIDYFGYNAVVFIAWTLAIIGWLKFQQILIKLEKISAEDWKIMKKKQTFANIDKQ